MAKKWALDDRKQLHKDANKALDENLMPGETVRVIIRGTHDAAMIGTDRRVFVFKKGFMGGATFGKKLASWDYRNVNGVQLETGMVSGVVLIQAPGVTAKDVSYWGSRKDSAQAAPHALALVREYFDQAREGTTLLRKLIAQHHNVPSASPSNSSATVASPMEQLRQLAALRDAGIVTNAEFEAKKADLLGLRAAFSVSNRTAYCTQCGTQVPVESNFCPDCGAQRR
jgi:Short C-terminal domain/zinc-ribbon domain